MRSEGYWTWWNQYGHESIEMCVQRVKAAGLAGVIVKYGYPAATVLKRLQNINSKLYRTDMNSTIVVTTDGTTCDVKPISETTDADLVTKTYKAEKNVDDSGNQFAKEKKININEASASELVGIPSLGAFKAQMIVKYRTRKGKFNSINDLVKVPGINQAVVDKIKDRIKAE